MAAPRWFPLAISQNLIPSGYEVVLTTNVACHLWLYWTDKEPWVHRTTSTRRGLAAPWEAYWCGVVWTLIPQEEAGDTTTHTFIWTGWVSCQTKYFRFHGTIGGAASPSDTAIFKLHFPYLPKGGIELLYPNADLYAPAGCFPDLGEEHWEDLDDRSPDEDASYVFWPNLSLEEIYGLTDLPGPPRTYGSVIVTARCRKTSPWAASFLRLAVETYENPYYHNYQLITVIYADYTDTWPVNPATGNPWTSMELDALRVRINMSSELTGTQARCTQLFITVT